MTAPGRRARVQFRRNEPDWGGSVEIGTNPVHRALGDARKLTQFIRQQIQHVAKRIECARQNEANLLT